jgi:esterase/lipase superfamily enzyme
MRRLLHLFSKKRENKNQGMKDEGKENKTFRVEELTVNEQSDINVFVRKFNNTFYTNLGML